MWDSPEYIDHYRLYFNNLIVDQSGAKPSSYLKYFFKSIEKFFTPLNLLSGQNWEDIISVYDVGGGGGDNYLKIKPFLSNQKLNWVIDDNIEIWNSTKDLRSLIIRERDLIQHFKYSPKFEYSILIIIGTISFINNFSFNEFIKRIGSKPKYIYVNRTFFQTKKQIFVQLAELKKMDVASKTIFPIQHYSVTRNGLEKQAIDLGYQLLKRGFIFPWFLKHKNGIKFGFYQDILFRRI
jgi:putative methyltransferase (TIGR04325 family)